MANVHTLTVTLEDGVLVVTPPTFPEPIATTDSVAWDTSALGDGWVVDIYFANQSWSPATIGPFQSLCRTSDLLLAKGNSGKGGEFSYRLEARRSDSSGETASSTSYRIDSRSGEPASGNVMAIQIESRVAADGSLSLVAVPPDGITPLFNGDLIAFQFLGLPAGAVPELVWTEDSNSPFGPFDSLTWMPAGSLLVGSGRSGVSRLWDFALVLVIVDVNGDPHRVQVDIEPGPDPVIDSEDYPIEY